MLSPTTPAQPATSTRILVADDDPVGRSILVSKLWTMKLNVSEIVEAEDGSEAWSKLRDGAFQLAIVDLDMPNINGFELMQCIRAHPRTKHMPIVVLTGRQDPASMRHALEAGASSFLTKPVYWSMFSPHIENLVRVSQGAIAAEAALVTAKQLAAEKDARFAALSAQLAERLDRIAGMARAQAARDDALPAIAHEAEAARALLKLQFTVLPPLQLAS